MISGRFLDIFLKKSTSIIFFIVAIRFENIHFQNTAGLVASSVSIKTVLNLGPSDGVFRYVAVEIIAPRIRKSIYSYYFLCTFRCENIGNTVVDNTKIV